MATFQINTANLTSATIWPSSDSPRLGQRILQIFETENGLLLKKNPKLFKIACELGLAMEKNKTSQPFMRDAYDALLKLPAFVLTNEASLRILVDFGKEMMDIEPYDISTGFYSLAFADRREPLRDPVALKILCKSFIALHLFCPKRVKYPSLYDHRPNFTALTRFSKEDLMKTGFMDILLSKFRSAMDAGLTYPGRYIFNDKPFEVLDELVKNLTDRTYNQNKPVALVIHNKADWNEAFKPDAGSEIQQFPALLKGYKVLVYEVANEDDMYMRIADTKYIYGKIPLLIIGGHGCPVALLFSYTPIYDDIQADILKLIRGNAAAEKDYLDITDTEIGCYEDCLSEHAQIVLASCSVGEGKEKGNNLANMLKNAFPGRKIYSPEVPTGVSKFVFDAKGLLVNVEYKCDINQTYIIGPNLKR